jgi:hypothetical protein
MMLGTVIGNVLGISLAQRIILSVSAEATGANIPDTLSFKAKITLGI